jgi:hypothetical protein
MKSLLVLARNDSREAIRVAAGLTIFGHDVNLIMMRKVDESEINATDVEILELADIEPLSTSADDDSGLAVISKQALLEHMTAADGILNF